MMFKSRNKLVATYSKRKQFTRIVKDNWLELENSPTNYQMGYEKAAKQLTSTPLGNAFLAQNDIEDLKPVNLLETGSFDTPLENRDALKVKHPSPDSFTSESVVLDIHHPRQLSGKRACRKSPTYNFNPVAKSFGSKESSEDSQIDLFSPLVSTSIGSMINKDDFVYVTPAEQIKTIKDDSVLLERDHCTPHQLNNTSMMSCNSPFEKGHEAIESFERVPEKPDGLSVDLSKMSILEDRVSVLVTPGKNAEASLMEISIHDEQKIAVLDRHLMLSQALPFFKKLLTQCRKVKDLETMVKHESCIKKIGEGTFGEVFMGKDTVYKVVPVGGHVEINDAEQTSFENAFQEIVVSRKLSDLAGDEVQMGKAFCQLKDVVLCEGKYPYVLLDAWDKFEESENERPDRFPDDQLYVVLQARYSGIQLEEFCSLHKLTADQAHSIVRQICCSLAAAEQKYEFEHRDLHWGNVLISHTTMEYVDFTQDGKTFTLRSHGLLATIIDFTFSRLETEGCLNYVDLEQEQWLFEGDVKVDIQYRVYRDMRSACRKNWGKFTPKTNVLWILYLIDKMNAKIKSHKLRQLRQALQSCKSASVALPIAFRSL